MPCIGSAAGDPEPIELPSTDPPLRAAAEAATTQGGQGSRSGTERVPAARPADADTPASRQRRAPKPRGTPSETPPGCIPAAGDTPYFCKSSCSCQVFFLDLGSLVLSEREPLIEDVGLRHLRRRARQPFSCPHPLAPTRSQGQQSISHRRQPPRTRPGRCGRHRHLEPQAAWATSPG